MSITNVFVGSLQQAFPAGQPASTTYKTLRDIYGSGILVGPSGVEILNNSNLVPAGNYTYGPAGDPQVTSRKASITELLRPYIVEQDLEDIAEKLFSEGFTLPTLRSLSDGDCEGLICEFFSKKSAETKFRFKAAIRHGRENPLHGNPLSKKSKWLCDEPLSSEMRVYARNRYFAKLLELPASLPQSVQELKDFLNRRSVKLPLLDGSTYELVGQSELVTLDDSEAAKQLAIFCESAFRLMNGPCPVNEASSSAELSYLTGAFIRFLNANAAPADRKLKGLRSLLDSVDLSTYSAASSTELQALKWLLRPDFQLFVKNCLILRWENNIDMLDLLSAADENTSKLKAWSTMFYGRLPYVIGGCCVGRQFRWLKLYPTGEKIVCQFISGHYDLNMLSDVARFLHSIIQMHCLLQKLQEEVGDEINLTLYDTLERQGGGQVTIYPNFVWKEIPALDKDRSRMIESVYEAIKDSSYLIQLEWFKTTRRTSTLVLKPVGDRHAEPLDLKDLVNATHDMLHGITDLHKVGYTHRDLRWENCIKINVRDGWKWVIIDLEAAGLANEEWVGAGLRNWDAKTLEKQNDEKKIYSKGSDMYQLGKLISEWLDAFPGGGKEERQVMSSLAEKLKQERTAAAKVLKEFCKKDCKRCCKSGIKLWTGF
ncbi:unnamed protein product [Calypogeia fissa]